MTLDASDEGVVLVADSSMLITGITEIVSGDSFGLPVLSIFPGILSRALKEVAFSDLLTLSLNKLLAMSLEI